MTTAPRSSTGPILTIATNFFVVRVLAISLTGVIAWSTLTPWAGSMPTVNIVYLDKLEHAAAFLAWVALVTLAWQRAPWQILILAALFGGSIELIQPLVGRDAELADFLADMLGAGAGLWIGLRVRAWRWRNAALKRNRGREDSCATGS